MRGCFVSLLVCLSMSFGRGDVCELTAATVKRIERWVHDGVDPGDAAFDALRCAAAGAAGGAAGAFAGGAAGAVAGARFGEALSSLLCDDESETCSSRARSLARLAGGLFGFVVGRSGGGAGGRVFARRSLFALSSHGAALRDCLGLLNVQGESDWAAVDKAYKARSRRDHPDKRGGSTEAMAKLNVCREVIKVSLAKQDAARAAL
ncbi:hypothetical protein M885DRAFT_624270 [Pelagophyceae sp. CCMP2097]|nr:hypothetical protein M885DRAFT_624270 [Pelagophyceae sp. CCMP2097]